MIINDKMLCIPPHLSTSWRQVSTLHLDFEKTLHVSLKNGLSVAIPGLDESVLDSIFALHAQHVALEVEPPFPFISSDILPKEMSINIDANLLDITSAFLQHNPGKSNSPDIPLDIINKLSIVTNKMGPIDLDKLPEAEPHCNCPHCQIVKAIRAVSNQQEEAISEEEIITDEDLRFKDWEITQTSDNLYVVTNPLDSYERYTVYLGVPVGCTCGHNGCEHITAVLRS